jgi:hypothetical protein
VIGDFGEFSAIGGSQQSQEPRCRLGVDRFPETRIAFDLLSRLRGPSCAEAADQSASSDLGPRG